MLTKLTTQNKSKNVINQFSKHQVKQHKTKVKMLLVNPYISQQQKNGGLNVIN